MRSIQFAAYSAAAVVFALLLGPSKADQPKGAMVGQTTGVRLQTGGAPVYPWLARFFEIEGKVVVKLRISAKGEVLDVKLHKSSGYQVLDDAAIRYAKMLQFVPARDGNKPVESEALLPVNFHLE